MPTKSPWIAFSERVPEEVAALDEPHITVMPRVMVTNNIDARNRMGEQSHAWYTAPMLNTATGEWVAFDDADRKILGLTHWFDPFNP